MALRPATRTALLLALLVAVGLAAVHGAAPGTHIGAIWPVGLASGLLVTVPRRHRVVVAGVVPLIAALTFASGGFPAAVTAGYAVSITTEVLVVSLLLTRRSEKGLTDDLDLAVFMGSALGGAATGAALHGATAWTTGFGTAWMIAIATLVAHLTSHLIFLPFFIDTAPAPGVSTRVETATRWLLVVAVTVAAFTVTDKPTLLFLLLPLIAWAALRASMRETLWLLIVIGVLSGTFSRLGLGPFAALQVQDGGTVDLDVLPGFMFLFGSALLAIPFSMAVRRQRRTTAGAAQERERLARIVASATATAIVETDDIGRITLFNPGAEALFGYPEAEVLGRTPDLFHTHAEVERLARELDVPADFMHVTLAAAELTQGPMDWRFVRKDGQERTMSMSLTQIRDIEGEVTGYLATAEDITERVRTQQALENALDAQHQAVERLQELDRARDNFVSTVSHELRTPMTNIIGYLEMLLEGSYGETSKPQHQALHRIELNSRRLLELIDDLLVLSSIESADLRLERAPVDLRSVVRRAVEDIRSTAERRNQHLCVDLPEEPVVVIGDARQLERMVTNLATNAAKFTPEGGDIWFRLRRCPPDEGWELEVEDTGIGIPAEEQPLLFTRFYRSASARENAIRGTGLGLSIARSIAELHGARISARSVPGVGSTFRIASASAHVAAADSTK